jgi:caffeoyl-CoA O-methyltransferase
MQLIPPDIEQYVSKQTDPVSPLLKRLEKETREKTPHPQMLSGPVEGRFLQMLIRLSGARNVLEIGTFTGYSALMMAEGLPEDGEIVTLEIDDTYADIAARYFTISPCGNKIQLIRGPARNSLSKLPQQAFDFIFIDADKGSYGDYYEEGIRLIRKGGLITVDNTLWNGKALRPDDDDSRAIARFNNLVQQDSRVEKVMLTIRDGIYLARKK